MDDHEQITDSVPAELFKRVMEFLVKSEKTIEEDPEADRKIPFEIIRMSLQDERERILEYMMNYRGWLMAKRKTFKKTAKEYFILSGAIKLLDFSVEFIERGDCIEGGMFDEKSFFE